MDAGTASPAPPRVIVLATDPGSGGGVQRVTRALIRALAEEVGADRVGLLATWGNGLDEANLPCVLLRLAPEADGEGVRTGISNKVGFVLSSVRAARRWRGETVIVSAHAWLAPVAWMCAAVSGSRFAQWAHGSEVWFRLSPWTRFGIRRASILFTSSAYTARFLERLGEKPLGAARVIRYPLGEGLPLPQPPDAPEGEGRYILAVGRLDAGERRKGVEQTIRAMSRTAEAMPGLRYKVIGDGGDRARLERLAADLGVADRVDFEGRLDDDEVAFRLQGAEALVMPSGQEGYGLVYIEAGRFGVPSVAADFGGAPEAVLDEVTGLVVPYDDTDALADAIIRLGTDRELRNRLGEGARVRSEVEHAFARFRDQIGQIVRDLDA